MLHAAIHDQELIREYLARISELVEEAFVESKCVNVVVSDGYYYAGVGGKKEDGHRNLLLNKDGSHTFLLTIGPARPEKHKGLFATYAPPTIKDSYGEGAPLPEGFDEGACHRRPSRSEMLQRQREAHIELLEDAMNAGRTLSEVIAELKAE